jgi:autotransporter-associated beta strand protein
VIEVSDAIRDVGIESGVTLTGNFQKTGAGQLFLKTLATGSVDIAAGEVVYSQTSASALFTTQSISGAGDLRFMGQAAGYFSFRPAYTGTLSLTGKTIVNLTPGSTNWYQGALFLEKDDVLSHASVLEMQSGKVYMRAQTGNGLTVAGLKGNVGTYVTTDQASIQKLTVDVASGQSHTYYGVIGADGTTAGKNNISFTKTGDGTQVLSGTNTYTGGTTVSAGELMLADNSQMLFVIGTNGVNNRIGGSGTLTANGDFVFDLTGAGATAGDSWTIVDAASLTESFGATFSVASFTDNGDNTWSKQSGAVTYIFDETTGGLSVIPEPATIGMLGLGALVTLVLRRMRT